MRKVVSGEAEKQDQGAIDGGHRPGLERANGLREFSSGDHMRLVDHHLRWSVEAVCGRRRNERPEEFKIATAEVGRDGANDDAQEILGNAFGLDHKGGTRLAVVTGQRDDNDGAARDHVF
jgi:hypothetical protein